jgi:hypothetical protein
LVAFVSEGKIEIFTSFCDNFLSTVVFHFVFSPESGTNKFILSVGKFLFPIVVAW